MKTIFIPESEEGLGLILAFLADRVDDFTPEIACAAMATVEGNEILGAVAYQNYRQTDIEMVCAGEPGWLNSRGLIRPYFAYPFIQLGCKRVTVICNRRNKRSRKFVERLGFRLEGVHREAMPDGRDAISYGMLRRECVWIDERMGTVAAATLAENPNSGSTKPNLVIAKGLI